jgi:acyl carrier protein
MVDISTMSRDALFTWVADLLTEMFELDRQALSPASSLYDDLDIDSIDAADLAVTMTKLTGRRIAPAVFKSIRTIGDVVDALAGLAAEQAS